MPSKHTESGRAAVTVRPGVLNALAHHIGAVVATREPVRVWELSGVERLHLEGGATVILKYAARPFNAEPDVLRWVGDHGVPAPRLFASAPQDDGGVAMLMEDLGAPTQQADGFDAVNAALAIHSCPSLPGLPTLNATGLAALPGRALASLQALQDAGRWQDTDDIRVSLERIADAADARAAGADIPPFGMVHSEFHHTSLHLSPDGMRILDWARAFTGSGLLDLVSWQGTVNPLDLVAVSDLISAYVAAGGPVAARAHRGGLTAAAWATGWHRVWILEWFLQQAAVWLPYPENDRFVQDVFRRHLAEATTCLSI